MRELPSCELHDGLIKGLQHAKPRRGDLRFNDATIPVLPPPLDEAALLRPIEQPRDVPDRGSPFGRRSPCTSGRQIRRRGECGAL